MIYYFRYFLVSGLLFLLEVSDIFWQERDDSQNTFSIDGRERIYYLNIPENLLDKPPLVFVFHGYGGNAKSMIGYSRMNAVADENGFAVCYTQGFCGDD